MDKILASKAFSAIIKGTFWVCVALSFLILFIIGNFLFKIYLLDYRFDDGEIHSPIEAVHMNENNI